MVQLAVELHHRLQKDVTNHIVPYNRSTLSNITSASHWRERYPTWQNLNPNRSSKTEVPGVWECDHEMFIQQIHVLFFSGKNCRQGRMFPSLVWKACWRTPLYLKTLCLISSRMRFVALWKWIQHPDHPSKKPGISPSRPPWSKRRFGDRKTLQADIKQH